MEADKLFSFPDEEGFELKTITKPFGSELLKLQELGAEGNRNTEADPEEDVDNVVEEDEDGNELKRITAAEGSELLEELELDLEELELKELELEELELEEL